jgi:hypothetical protein
MNRWSQWMVEKRRRAAKVVGRRITMQGIVIPVEWDHGGKPIKVALSTFTEEEYILEDQKAGGRLLGLLHDELEVTGRVQEKGGRKIIKVERYKKAGRGFVDSAAG